MRIAVVEELREAIPFDGYAWVLTDPETEVGSSPLAALPAMRELPRLIRLKYTTALHRWTGLDTPPSARLSAASDADLEQSGPWCAFLSGYGVVDIASIVLRDRHGCWGFLDLWRTGSAGPFTEVEERLLGRVAPLLCAAIRRCHAATFDGRAAEEVLDGPAVLVLSPDLAVRGQTPATAEVLRRLLPPDVDHHPIPAAAYNVAAQLLAVEHGIDDHPPRARVHLDRGRWLTLRAARIGDVGPDADIAVTIDATPPAERLTLFVRAFGLSAREAELVTLLDDGADTRQIASAMFVSDHTVQDHLKSIFDKTGTRNRRTLLARVRG